MYTIKSSFHFRPGTIVGFGNPLLDMTVTGNQNLLDKYGLNNNDAILAEEKHMPLYEEILNNDQIEFTAGGSAQNSLRIVQVFINRELKYNFFYHFKFIIFYFDFKIK